MSNIELRNSAERSIDMVETEKKLRPPVFKKKGKEKSASACLKERVRTLLAENARMRGELERYYSSQRGLNSKVRDLESELLAIKDQFRMAEETRIAKEKDLLFEKGRVDGLTEALEVILDHSS